MIYEQIEVDILTSTYGDLDDIQKWKVIKIHCQKFQILQSRSSKQPKWNFQTLKNY
jgi:hypothetical protein